MEPTSTLAMECLEGSTLKDRIAGKPAIRRRATSCMRRLAASGAGEFVLSFSPDGQFLAFVRADPKTQRDIWVLSIGDRKRSLFLGTPATEGAARFSPDGRWIAYVSDESGRPEIYVQPYPGPGGNWFEELKRLVPTP